MPIIKNEEQRTNSCSSEEAKGSYAVLRLRTPSLLARVAVVFYVAVLFLMGFLDDDGHRVLPHMKRNTHVLSPLSVQGVGTAASQLTLRYPLRGKFIVWFSCFERGVWLYFLYGFIIC